MYPDQDISRYEKAAMRAELYEAVESCLATDDEQREWQRRDPQHLQIGIPRRGALRIEMRHVFERAHDGNAFRASTSDVLRLRGALVRECLRGITAETRQLVACHLRFHSAKNVPPKKRSPSIDSFLAEIEEGNLETWPERQQFNKPQSQEDRLQSTYQPLYERLRNLVGHDDETLLSYVDPADIHCGFVHTPQCTSIKIYLHANRDLRSIHPSMQNRLRIWLWQNVETRTGDSQFRFSAEAINGLCHEERDALAYALDNTWQLDAANAYKEDRINMDQLVEKEAEIVFHTNNIRHGRVSS